MHLQLGNEIAFVYRRGFRTHRWSYRQVGQLACCFARELERRKIGKGDRVMLWGDNSAEWVAAFFGCMLRGAVAVPMDKIAAPGFAQRVAADVDARLYVGSASLAEHAKGVPWIELEALHDAIVNLEAAMTVARTRQWILRGTIRHRSSLPRAPRLIRGGWC